MVCHRGWRQARPRAFDCGACRTTTPCTRTKPNLHERRTASRNPSISNARPADMTFVLEPRDLTPDQQKAIQMDCLTNKAIVGSPGSGKTQILLHRARYLMDELGTEPERLHVFVLTQVMKQYVVNALRDLDIL